MDQVITKRSFVITSAESLSNHKMELLDPMQANGSMSLKIIVQNYKKKNSSLHSQVLELTTLLEEQKNRYEEILGGYQQELSQAQKQAVQINRIFMARLLCSERKRRHLETLLLDQEEQMIKMKDEYDLNVQALTKGLKEFYLQRLKNPRDVRADDLKEDSVLGVGSYGCIRKVFTADDPERRRPLAIKLIERKDTGNGYFNLLDEPNIQATFSSTDFIAKIYKVFNNLNGYIGMLMPIYTWDMSQMIESKASFVKSNSKFYFANMVACVQVIHKRGIVHRDVKPSNFMLSSSGYLVLGDFGFATYSSDTNKHLNDRVGTPPYMSPEMWLQIGHNKQCDIWGLGCCLYELHLHKPAFRGSSCAIQATVVKQGISHASKSMTKLHRNIQEVIQACCRFEGEERPEVHDLQDFRYLSPIDWMELKRRRVKAPCIPDSK